MPTEPTAPQLTDDAVREIEENHAPKRLTLWICCHCGNPRLYGSSSACKTCGTLLHDTGEYVRGDAAAESDAALREQLAEAQRCHANAEEDLASARLRINELKESNDGPL